MTRAPDGASGESAASITSTVRQISADDLGWGRLWESQQEPKTWFYLTGGDRTLQNLDLLK